MTRTSQRVFATRVARRVFLLFVLIGMLPVVAMGIFAHRQITVALTSAADEQLGESSRTYGQLIYRSLVLADEALSEFPLATASFGPIRDKPAEFDAVARLSGGQLDPVFGRLGLDSLDELGALSASRSSLVVVETGQGTELYIVDPRPAASAFAIGRIASGYVWDPSLLPAQHDVCVLSAALPTPLFCSSPISDAGLSQLASSLPEADTSIVWETDGRRFRAARWDLFVGSGFEGSSWRVVSFTDEASAMQTLDAVERTFPILLLLVLVTVTLLSIWQIRRSLTPLDALVAGTRRIASQDFDQPVALSSRDEFGDLARALNDMASRLGRQFASLKTLGEIDRLILSSGDLEHVLQTALTHSRELMPSGAAAVLILDTEAVENAHLVFVQHDIEQAAVKLMRVPTTEEDRDRLRRHPRAHVMNADESPVFAEFAAAQFDRVWVFPISTNQAFSGALLFGFRKGVELPQGDEQAGRDLADRLAVAMSASEREAVLFNQAHFDALTGLPNRELCRDRLHQALAQARRNDRDLALLFLDLDGFKTINDSMGHSAGDTLLRDVSSRLLSCVRDTDTVARLGGDEFVVILPQVMGVTEIESVAKKIMATLKRPVTVNGKDVFVTVSIGVTKYPEDGDTAESLLQKADAAMYDAKAAGRSRYVFFTNEIEERATERLSLETDLRVALDRGELMLRYQPQLSLDTEEVECAEVLIRWQHPMRGPIEPSLFIPILEDMGLIDSIGDWVLSEAIKQLRQWQFDGLPFGRIAVNVSPRQIRQRNFAERVTDILRVYDLPPNCLELEITESVFFDDMDRSNDILGELRAAGVQISIDDFGTGYSSFSYLRDLQFDAVKIDRAFVRDLPDRRALAIANAIVAVAQTLNKYVTAEGVETEVQLARLRDVGVNAAQGFLISRPLAAADLAHWIRKTAAGEDLSPSFIARALG